MSKRAEGEKAAPHAVSAFEERALGFFDSLAATPMAVRAFISVLAVLAALALVAILPASVNYYSWRDIFYSAVLVSALLCGVAGGVAAAVVFLLFGHFGIAAAFLSRPVHPVVHPSAYFDFLFDLGGLYRACPPAVRSGARAPRRRNIGARRGGAASPFRRAGAGGDGDVRPRLPLSRDQRPLARHFRTRSRHRREIPFRGRARRSGRMARDVPSRARRRERARRAGSVRAGGRLLPLAQVGGPALAPGRSRDRRRRHLRRRRHGTRPHPARSDAKRQAVERRFRDRDGRYRDFRPGRGDPIGQSRGRGNFWLWRR